MLFNTVYTLRDAILYKIAYRLFVCTKTVFNIAVLQKQIYIITNKMITYVLSINS